MTGAVQAALAGQAAAEAIMVAKCRIVRDDPDAPEEWNPATGVTTLAGLIAVYDGKCRLRQPMPTDKAQASGGFTWTLQDSILSLPVSAVGVRLKDTVTIYESPNAGDLEAVFEVVLLPRGTFTTARRFVVREAP